MIEPQLRGDPAPVPDMALAAFVDLYLDRHAASAKPRTIDTLRERLAHAVAAFGDVPLRELERMSGDLATWEARLPEGSRYRIVRSIRQLFTAAVRWEHMASNPALRTGVNRQPLPRAIRTYTRDELAAIVAELSPTYAPLPPFVAATGLRTHEWQATERKDIDRRRGILTVARTVSNGEIVDLGKTVGSRREVPLSRRALNALDALPPRLDSPLLFPAPEGGVLNLNNWRRRVWAPAIDAAGIARPARIYDLRATFISEALAAGAPVFEVARIAGTSVRMIERHYGRLLDGSASSFAAKLDAFDAAREEADHGTGEGTL